MRIGLIGYGKMGKAIEDIALERGHSISFKVNSSNKIEQVELDKTDVAIEFSQPELAVHHINTCLDNHLPIVVGTTAWDEHFEEVQQKVNGINGTLIYASNFSIGVNLFFQLNEKLAQLMSNQKEYNAELEEIHHVQKLDAPSGTAVSLAKGILENHPKYDAWVCEVGQKPTSRSNQLPVTALREPEVPGTHVIKYTSEIDSITISHEAHNRKGFALGAVIAAEYIKDKKGMFTMKDVLSI